MRIFRSRKPHYHINERVFVNQAGITINEPATIKKYDARDNAYWCILDNGSKEELASLEGKTREEINKAPAWYSESEISRHER